MAENGYWNNVRTKAYPSSDCILSSVPYSNQSAQLIGANDDRRFLVIRNTGSMILHICPGKAAATQMMAVASLTQNTTWEAPAGFIGPVQGIWADGANDGVAVVAEYV